MRPIMNMKMCVSVAAALAAPAFAPTPAYAASADYYLKLGGVEGDTKAKGDDRHKDQIEILSWSWGASQKVNKVESIAIKQKTAPAAGGVQVAAGDVTGDGKYGAVAGAHRDDGVDPDAGAPAEKRQHGWVAVAKPLDRGAVRVKVKLPWLDCKVGAAFPDAMLQNDAGRYEFKDAIITGCAPDSVSLNYAKVTVRGWNPETKE